MGLDSCVDPLQRHLHFTEAHVVLLPNRTGPRNREAVTRGHKRVRDSLHQAQVISSTSCRRSRGVPWVWMRVASSEVRLMIWARWGNGQMTPTAPRTLAPLFCAHVNPYGTFELDMVRRTHLKPTG